MNAFEIIGYLASILVAISLMMKSIVRLRWINLVGATLFTIYGLVIRAYPVAAVNFFIILVNLYFLYEIYTAREYFHILQVQPVSDYLRYFLQFYRGEINKHQPQFSGVPEEKDLILFVLRDLVPAGIFIGKPDSEGNLFTRLDFVIPGYRDFKIGKYIFQDNQELFREQGIRRIYSPAGAQTYSDYLQKMGFRAENGVYCLEIG